MPKIANHKVTGPLVLKDLGSLLENEYEFLDISEPRWALTRNNGKYALAGAILVQFMATANSGQVVIFLLISFQVIIFLLSLWAENLKRNDYGKRQS